MKTSQVQPFTKFLYSRCKFKLQKAWIFNVVSKFLGPTAWLNQNKPLSFHWAVCCLGWKFLSSTYHTRFL